MFGNRWRILRLAGIPIYIDLSWLVILALITWTLEGLFRQELPGLQPGAYWIMGLVAAVAFFTCILLHEMGHALVARSSGIPIRGITLFLFGGVAEMTGEPPSAGKEFFMAIAGPAVSLVLAGVFYVVAVFGRQSGWPAEVVVVLTYLAFINFVVLIFNMLPGFPLDGGRVLRSILWGITGSLRRSTRWASLVGQGFAWLLIAIAVMFLFTGTPAGLINGIWFGLIGLFLNAAARNSYQQVILREMLKGEHVARFMNREPIVVPPSVSLRSWVEDYVYRYHRKGFPVAANGHLEGFVSTRALEKYPRVEWDHHTVGEVMNHDLQKLTITPQAEALDALAQMQRTGSSRLLVTDGDQLVGIVSLKDLLRFLQLKMDLEEGEHIGASNSD
jgi:Zn-dependent protease/CBS domain-containing protein